MKVQGFSSGNGLTVKWQQFKVCHNCEHRCPDVLAPYCPECSAPYPLAEFKAWRAHMDRVAARPWLLRWLP